MAWIYLAMASAAALGLYDVSKKAAVTENAVLPTIWASTCTSWLLLAPLAAAGLSPWAMQLVPPELGVRSLGTLEHLAVFFKALLVTLSWGLSFSAVKHLPISLAGPLRATAPLFTLLGAVLLFGERPTAAQWGGMAIVISGYVAFVLIGQVEGLRWRSNRWLWALLGGTLLGAASGLYDKVLVQGMSLEPVTLQFWFCTYNLLLQTVLVAALWWRRRAQQAFQWRASVLAVGALLVLADQLYFRALAGEGALLSVISLVRRSNVLLSFAVGGWLFHERLLLRKAAGLGVIALGLFVLHAR